MTVIEIVIVLIVGIVLVAHVGIAWNLMCMPGNLFDWVPVKVQKIKNPYLKDLLQCAKCISGQYALWTWVAICFFADLPVIAMIGGGIVWISAVIVVTDQGMRRYGY